MRVLRLFVVFLLLLSMAIANAQEIVPLFEGRAVVAGTVPVNIGNRWVFDSKSVKVYCNEAATAYVKTDNGDGTYRNPIVDNYITAGNDTQSICTGGNASWNTAPSPISGTNCFTAGVALSPGAAATTAYTSDATASVSLTSGENNITFKLWDWGSWYANSKLVLQLPSACSATPPPINVSIDIKPGSNPNSVNLCTNGVVTVAILGSATFNVGDVNLDTLVFGTASPRLVGKGNKSSCNYVDVSGNFETTLEGRPDGFVDLVCQYNTIDLAGLDSSMPATVTGKLLSGRTFTGSDTINIVKEGCQ